MKLQIFTILAICLFLTLSQARFTSSDNLGLQGEVYLEQDTYWFEQQILDHFIEQPVTHWKQRYHVVSQFFEQKTGPLFLYIGGESADNGFSSSSFVIDLAEKFDGAAISIEHRFYGQSQPFGQNADSYSIENLRYLTHQQALADLANFILYLKSNNMYGIHEKTPVICVGGSYPGALSAWFRYKYEHLTIGALASSAVVNAIDDYMEFDMQVGDSATVFGSFCPTDIETLTAYAQSQVEDPETSAAFKAKFNASQLTDNTDFLYYFADLFALQVQYGKASNLCNTQLKSKSFDEQLETMQEFARTTNQQTPNDYDQDKLKNTSYSESANIRQWTYQTCTYFGWFYAAAKIRPMRSPTVNVEYFHNLCENVYGKGYIPNTDNTDLIMGGTDMNVSNILFTNGSQDPWRWASIQKDQFPMKAFVGDCDSCGHCFDLSSPQDGQPKAKTEVQDAIIENMELWIGQYWDEQNQVLKQEL